MGMLETLWSTPVRRTITSVTAGLGLVAALGGAVDAWPKIEPMLPAQRYYVILKVSEVMPVLNEVRKNGYERDKRDLEREQAQWKIKLPTERDPQTQIMINRRLDELTRDLAKVQQNIDELKKKDH